MTKYTETCKVHRLYDKPDAPERSCNAMQRTAILILPMESVGKDEKSWPIQLRYLNIITKGLRYEQFANQNEPEGTFTVVNSDLIMQITGTFESRGWFAKVLDPGAVKIGDTIEKLLCQ